MTSTGSRRPAHCFECFDHRRRPAGSDPRINEIGYYAPGHNLVLYYGDVGYYNGIIRIGRFDDAIDTIADQPDGVGVTVERA